VSAFEIGEHKTRSRQVAHVLARYDDLLIGVVHDGGYVWACRWFADTGRTSLSNIEQPFDLMPPPAPRVTRRVWVSIYPDGIASSSPSRETADHFSNPSRLACICIAIDVPEGYGLIKDEPPILVRAG